MDEHHCRPVCSEISRRPSSSTASHSQPSAQHHLPSSSHNSTHSELASSTSSQSALQPLRPAALSPSQSSSQPRTAASSRSRSSPPAAWSPRSSSRRPSVSSPSHSSSHTATEPPRKPVVEAQWRNGVLPKGKEKASDYDDPTYTHLLDTVHEYEAYVQSENILPSKSEAKSAIHSIWTLRMEYEPADIRLSSRMLKIVMKANSHCRGSLKERVRPIVEVGFYGFLPAVSDANILANKSRSAQLLAGNKFLYKDPENSTGYMRHPAIQASITAAWFRVKEYVGNRFPEFFEPLSRVSFYLILSVIKFHIICFEDGIYTPRKMNEDALYPLLHEFQPIVEDWWKAGPEQVDRYLQRLADKCRKSANVKIPNIGKGLSEDAKKKAYEELDQLNDSD